MEYALEVGCEKERIKYGCKEDVVVDGRFGSEERY